MGYDPPAQNLEAEDAVIGSLLLDSKCLHTFTLPNDDFFGPRQRSAYGVICDMVLVDHKPVDVLTVHDAMMQTGNGDPRLLEWLTETAARVPTTKNVAYYAQIVARTATKRRTERALAEQLSKVRSCDVADIATATEAAYRAVLQATDARARIQTSAQVFDDMLSKLVPKKDRKQALLRTGIGVLDQVIGGIPMGCATMVGGRTSMGKAQPIDARVKTISGWKNMGDLQLGDELASPDGSPSRVVAIYPQGSRQVYQVTFADGRSTECCDEHLWTIHCNQSGRAYRQGRASLEQVITVPLSRIRRMLLAKHNRNRIWVDTPSGNFGHHEVLPVDPYVLGVLLGDGGLTGGAVRFTSADKEIAERVSSRLNFQSVVVVKDQCNRYGYSIVTRGGHHPPRSFGVVPNSLKESMKTLGVWGKRSEQKSIPQTYLLASWEARLELLRGLLDTDGWVQPGSICYCTTSAKLRDDVIELARSLGGVANYWSRTPSFTHRGESHKGKQAFYLCISHPEPSTLFSLPRKVSAVTPRKRRRLLTVKEITPTRVTETQCIVVSHPSQLYITDGYTLTHNSCLCRNIADNVSRAGFGVGYISLEDASIKTSRWMALRHARVPIERVIHDLLTRQEIERIKAQRENLAHRSMYFCDQGALTGGAICQRARQMIAMGCRLIVLDFVNRAKLPRDRSRNEELMDEVVGPICDLAKESEVAFMVAAQLNRDSEKDARPPQLIDFKDCGGIEESAEVALLVHRQWRIRQDEKKPRLQKAIDIIVAKQKEGECRTVRCYFEGPLGYVCDPPEPDFFNDLSKGLLLCKVDGCKKLAIYDEDRCGLHLAPPEEGSLPFKTQESQAATA